MGVAFHYPTSRTFCLFHCRLYDFDLFFHMVFPPFQQTIPLFQLHIYHFLIYLCTFWLKWLSVPCINLHIFFFCNQILGKHFQKHNFWKLIFDLVLQLIIWHINSSFLVLYNLSSKVNSLPLMKSHKRMPLSCGMLFWLKFAVFDTTPPTLGSNINCAWLHT